MAQVSLIVKHGCGFCRVSKMYPEVLMVTYPVYFEKVDNRIFATIKIIIRAPTKEQIHRYLEDLKKYESIFQVQELKGSDTVLECTANFVRQCEKNAAYVLVKYGINLVNVTFLNGEEIITGDIPDHLLKSIIDELRQKWPVKLIKRRGKINIPKELTEKEILALKLARRFGYYGEKRKITLQKLAQKCKISGTAFRNNLRRAERKLFTQMIDEL